MLLQPLFGLAGKKQAKAPETRLRKSTGTVSMPGMLSLKEDVDWEKTRAYAPFGWSGIYINTKDIRPNGSVDPQDYDAIRDELVAKWDKLVNPYTKEKVGGPVHTNAEMYHGEFSQYGPDVMPLPLENKHMPVCFFGFTSKQPVYKNITLYGNHVMDGILCASGKGIQQGARQDAILYDLAPTIMHLFGLPVPDDMDGKVLSGILDETERAKKIESQHATDEGQATEGLTPEEEAELREKLMGLGYL